MVYCLYPYCLHPYLGQLNGLLFVPLQFLMCLSMVYYLPRVSLYGVLPYLGQLNGLLFVPLLFAPLPGTIEWFTVCTLAVPHVSLYGVFPY